MSSSLSSARHGRGTSMHMSKTHACIHLTALVIEGSAPVRARAHAHVDVYAHIHPHVPCNCCLCESRAREWWSSHAVCMYRNNESHRVGAGGGREGAGKGGAGRADGRTGGAGARADGRTDEGMDGWTGARGHGGHGMGRCIDVWPQGARGGGARDPDAHAHPAAPQQADAVRGGCTRRARALLTAAPPTAWPPPPPPPPPPPSSTPPRLDEHRRRPSARISELVISNTPLSHLMTKCYFDQSKEVYSGKKGTDGKLWAQMATFQS